MRDELSHNSQVPSEIPNAAEEPNCSHKRSFILNQNILEIDDNNEGLETVSVQKSVKKRSRTAEISNEVKQEYQGFAEASTLSRQQVRPQNDSSCTKSEQSSSSSQRFGRIKGDSQAALDIRPYISSDNLYKQPTRVLSEESYTEILEAIIVREFFPRLYKLRKQKQVLDASGHDSTQKTVEAMNAIEQEEDYTISKASQSKLVKLLDGRNLVLDLTRLNLAEFQALFTSEDNCSFEQVVIKEKSKLAREQAWIENAAIAHNLYNQKLKSSLNSIDPLPAQLRTADVDARTALMFPYSSDMYGRMKILAARDPAGQIKLLGGYLGEKPKPALRTGDVVAKNSRFEPKQENLNQLIYEQALKKVEDLSARQEEASLFDKMVEEGVYSALELMEQKEKKEGSSSRLSATRHLDHAQPYSFVHTPIFKPGENTTPLITWGEVAATPIALPSYNEDALNKSFKIPEPSAKDLAAIKLADSAAKKLSQQRAKQNSTLRKILFTPLATSARQHLFGTPSQRSLLKSVTPRNQTRTQHYKKIKSVLEKTPPI